MSTIRSIDLKFVDDLVDFVRGPGYVLDFSDSTFAEFFATELKINIDDPAYAKHGGSKGKRLRYFLQKEDNPTAARALTALWEYRAELLIRTRQNDPVPQAESRFKSLLTRLTEGVSTSAQSPASPRPDPKVMAQLLAELNAVRSKPPQDRGYAFESFLKRAFDIAGLKAREPFRNVGEQIDGSFLLGDEIYLLEAKWREAPSAAADLHGFHGKIEQKAAWARGLFISYNGFTDQGLIAFGTGKRLICMDGRDLYDALDQQISLKTVLERKLRHAAETGKPFAPVRKLFGFDV
jgi:Restriction endonuclease